MASVNRFEWLKEQLDISDRLFLEQEAVYFADTLTELAQRMALDESQRTPAEELELRTKYDHFKHCVAGLTDVAEAYKNVHTELSRAFSWHLAINGESFWRTMHHKYAERAFEAKRKRIQEVSDAAKAESEARVAAKKEAAANQLQADAEFVAYQTMAHDVRAKVDLSDDSEETKVSE